MGNISVKLIKATDIKAHLNESNAKRHSQKTIRTQLLIYSLILSHAAEGGDVDFNVCLNVTMPKHMKPPEQRGAALENDEDIIKRSVDKWLLPA